MLGTALLAVVQRQTASAAAATEQFGSFRSLQFASGSCLHNSLPVHPHAERVAIAHQPKLPKVVAAPDEHVPAACQR
jgi:hypothetical protein